MAEEYAKIETNAFYVEEVNKNSHKRSLEQGFISGYNKAKEKYKWTDEDVIKIVEKSRRTGLTAEYLMTSFQQPKMPVGFKCETERKLVLNLGIDIYNPNTHVYSDEPKTTTNSQGLTQWVGKYIY